MNPETGSTETDFKLLNKIATDEEVAIGVLAQTETQVGVPAKSKAW